jgi:MOSC domain-containing protein YiiM
MKNSSRKDGGGVIRKIGISREKGRPREEVAEGFFEAGFGLRGDSHSGPGEKQVVILGIEGRERMKESPEEGLCFRRFKETVSTAGIDLFRLPAGSRVRVGESVWEISRTRKDCYPQCVLVRAGRPCALAREVVFARVIASGPVRKGDRVVPVNPPGTA